MFANGKSENMFANGKSANMFANGGFKPAEKPKMPVVNMTSNPSEHPFLKFVANIKKDD